MISLQWWIQSALSVSSSRKWVRVPSNSLYTSVPNSIFLALTLQHDERFHTSSPSGQSKWIESLSHNPLTKTHWRMHSAIHRGLSCGKYPHLPEPGIHGGKISQKSLARTIVQRTTAFTNKYITGVWRIWSNAADCSNLITACRARCQPNDPPLFNKDTHIECSLPISVSPQCGMGFIVLLIPQSVARLRVPTAYSLDACLSTCHRIRSIVVKRVKMPDITFRSSERRRENVRISRHNDW
jgi:hypothetical protein